MARAAVYDDTIRRMRLRESGEKVAGVSFILPVLTRTESHNGSTPVEAGSTIWDPTEFDVFETKWRAIVSQIGGAGTGTLELYNYTDSTSIATFTIASASSYVFHETTVTLPSSGASKLIGCRLSRANGAGTVLAHASALCVREN